ncbi:MAG: hypothetical protein ABIQ72_16440 [Usitatibacter sp.]
MKPTAFRNALFTLLLATTALQAAEPRRIEELMHKSGLWTQLGQSQEQIRGGAQQAQAQAKAGKGGKVFNDDDFAKLVAAMNAAYAPDKLRSAMARELEAQLSAADEMVVLEWLSSDLGQRLTKIEEESGEPAKAAAAERESSTHLAAVPEMRIARFARMITAIQLGEATASMVINMTTAIGFGMAMANATEDPAELAQTIRNRLEPQREQMVETFNKRAIQSFAYVYRDVSDDDMEKYVVFSESPAGRRYHAASVRAMDNVLARAGIQMGREFEALMREPARRS